MKKIKLISIATLLFYVSPIKAIEGPESLTTNSVPTNLPQAVASVSNTILLIIGTIAVLFLIVGGFQYVTSAGNPDSIGKAKSTIMYALIGIVFAILAYAIVGFVISNIK